MRASSLPKLSATENWFWSLDSNQLPSAYRADARPNVLDQNINFYRWPIGVPHRSALYPRVRSNYLLSVALCRATCEPDLTRSHTLELALRTDREHRCVRTETTLLNLTKTASVLATLLAFLRPMRLYDLLDRHRMGHSLVALLRCCHNRKPPECRPYTGDLKLVELKGIEPSLFLGADEMPSR